MKISKHGRTQGGGSIPSLPLVSPAELPRTIGRRGQRDIRGETYNSLLLRAKHLQQNRLLIGIPMTGLVRSEWSIARWGQIIPCNWGASDCIQWMNNAVPLDYGVAEARNIIVDMCLQHNFQWLLFKIGRASCR